MHAAPDGTRGAALVGDDELLERELEFATIQALLDRVGRAGRGGRLLIEGPAGIGKSALLRATCARAEEGGIRVLAAEASEVASQVAFGCARTLLAGRWPEEAAEAAAMIRRAVRVVLDLAEEGPLLLALDDAQWADSASLRWLALLARHLTSAPVALALAVRSGPTDGAGPALRELLDDRRAVVVRPARLSEAAAARLLRERLDVPLDEELAAVCHADTGGNPYLLRTLGDALRQAGVPAGTEAAARIREIGSRAVSREVARRLAELDDEARELVYAAAAVGNVGDVGDLAAIVDLDPTRAADAARRLTEVDLLRSVRSAELSHPLVADAVRAEMGAVRRERLGRAAAEHLVARGEVEEAAARLVDLPPRADPAVVETLARAAEIASGRGAPDVGAKLLARALAEPPEPGRGGELRAALGRALLAVADEEAIPVLEQALEEAPPGPASAPIAAALARALHYVLRVEDALAVLDDAAERCRAADPGLAEELEAQALLYLSFDQRLRPVRRERLERRGEERGVSELAYRMRLAELANESVRAGRPAPATVALAERALAGGVLLSSGLPSFLNAVAGLVYAGRPAAGRFHLQDMMARAGTIGEAALLGVALGVHGEARRIEGDVVAAEADLRTALELPEAKITRSFALRGLLEALVEQDQVETAVEELRRGGLTEELPDAAPAAGLLYARGRVRIASGAVRPGLDDMQLAGEMLVRLDIHDPQVVPWRLAAAEALIELGEAGRAEELIGEYLERASLLELPEAIAPALRLRGLLRGGAAGRADLEEAVALLDGSFARLDLARALIALGTAVGEDDRAAARERIGRGATLAEELGAVAVARRGTERLVQVGGRPRRGKRRGARALTPAERRVARLAAEGMTNREAAETLVVSEKTIETHLAAAFRKLGIGARGQLAGALGHSGEG
jgi:DNA-binding CsgD family transcriptional regulator